MTGNPRFEFSTSLGKIFESSQFKPIGRLQKKIEILPLPEVTKSVLDHWIWWLTSDNAPIDAFLFLQAEIYDRVAKSLPDH